MFRKVTGERSPRRPTVGREEGCVASDGSGRVRVVDVPAHGVGAVNTVRSVVPLWVADVRPGHVGLTSPVGTGGEVFLTPVPPTTAPQDTPF